MDDINIPFGKFRSQTIEPTVACNAICKGLLEVANGIRAHVEDISGINLYDNFWVPIGRQIIGSIISHLRKQKISVDGAKYVTKDLSEYYNVRWPCLMQSCYMGDPDRQWSIKTFYRHSI